MTTTRRDWMKSALMFTAAMPLASLTDYVMAAPASKAEEEFVKANGRKLIRLGSNENPYGPSEKARKAMIERLSESNRYAFGVIEDFRKTISEHEQVPEDHILLGAGSGELLCLAGMVAGLEGGSVLSANPTFMSLVRYAEVFKARWDKVDLDDTLTHDLEALASAVKSDTRILFIVNPHNPTGTLLPADTYRAFCEEMSKKTIVYADEAYLEFLDPAQQTSMVELVRKGHNVIVSRTFSKIYGLAGLRIGYIVAKPELIRRVRERQTGTIISQPALAAARASLGDHDFMKYTRTKNAEASKHLQDYLASKKWFYGKSLTNKVFFEAPRKGSEILAETEKRGFEIRVWDYKGKEWCRVSIGTLDEMKAFTKAFDEVVS